MRLDEAIIIRLQFETISELTRERDEARAEAAGYLSQLQEDPLAKQLAVAEAAVAGAYRLASDAFKDEYSNHDNPLIGVMHGLKAINVLTPPDAIRAEKRLVAQARFDIVKALYDQAWGECLCNHTDENCCAKVGEHCWDCTVAIMLIDLTAALAAIEKETE